MQIEVVKQLCLTWIPLLFQSNLGTRIAQHFLPASLRARLLQSTTTQIHPRLHTSIDD